MRTIHGNEDSYDDPNKVGVGTILPDSIKALLNNLYPGGLMNRSSLDAGCNRGAFCILAKELGASQVLVFDVCEHWIKQAQPLLWVLETDVSNMEFLANHLHEYEAPARHFDATLFKGVFCHLLNSILAVEELCSRTKNATVS